MTSIVVTHAPDFHPKLPVGNSWTLTTSGHVGGSYAFWGLTLFGQERQIITRAGREALAPLANRTFSEIVPIIHGMAELAKIVPDTGRVDRLIVCTPSKFTEGLLRRHWQPDTELVAHSLGRVRRLLQQVCDWPIKVEFKWDTDPAADAACGLAHRATMLLEPPLQSKGVA